ncbi:MAG: HPr(Ser) kinase/phosphatase [Ruminococcaceae bacterium]|nr:HPr(Ser) kinase/phosphatase [Oscillospiraceae bacterium]
MMQKYTVSLEKIIKDHKFEVLYMPKAASDIYVSTADVNRPGMFLCGYEEYFDSDRVQFIGLTELEYMKSLPEDEGEKTFERLLEKQPVCIIITRGLELPEKYIALAQKHEVPLLLTLDQTSRCMSTIIAYLNVELAPRITRHGVLLEVSGEGVLILGDSGVGKSETALELIKRGHRLIADDAVEIRRVSEKTLVGSAPDNIRHYIELRGVGIINARRIFGMGAVKLTEKIDMVVQLELWDNKKIYDRLGLEDEKMNILGVDVPVTTVPVKPGRNLSIIIEAAAMNNRQKKMGYNAARELLHSLGMTDDIMPDEKELESWQKS